MKTLRVLEKHKCFGGWLTNYEHDSAALGCPMQFSAFLPPQAKRGKALPFLTFLPGLTACYSHFAIQCGAYAAAAELGLAVFAADTSPRCGSMSSEYWDLGRSAGFYLNAAKAPWKKNYQMETYITKELNRLLCENFPVAPKRQGIFGHSMGGHGALSLGLKHPGLYKSISALAPLVSVMAAPLARRALIAYLGNDKAEWRKHDVCALLEARRGARAAFPPILVDQGLADELREPELKPDLLIAACKKAGQELNIRFHPGYDHGYCFVQTFIGGHLRHHAALLEA